MSHRRIILGVLASAAALVAIPSAANAATCTYDPATSSMEVRYGAADTGVTLANNGDLQYRETGSTFMRSCYSPTGGISAKASNTAKLTVAAFKGTGPSQQKTTFDETQGNIIDGNPNMNIYVFTGTGGDHLILKEGGADDSIRLTNNPALGPQADLDGNGRPDLRMTTSNDAVAEVYGGGGGDTINAAGASTYTVWEYGEAGEDWLIGTERAGDYLFGGGDNDHLFTYTDDVKDSVFGGTGADSGYFDYGVDALDSVETVANG